MDITPRNEHGIPLDPSWSPKLCHYINVAANKAEYATKAKLKAKEVMGNNDCNTMAQVITITGVVDELRGKGPYTLLFTTDAAWSKVPNLEDLMKTENKDKLTKIIKMHVLLGRTPMSDMGTNKLNQNTAAGEAVNFSRDNNIVKVNDATVIHGDLDTSNGFIHFLDTVLMPAE